MKTVPINKLGREGPLHSIHYDKGRRHYWNIQKSDYGFNESTNKQLMHRLEMIQSMRRHSLHRNDEYSSQRERILFHSAKHKNCLQDNNQQEPQSPKKSKFLDINKKTIQIQLPTIRKTRQTATQSDELAYTQSLKEYNNSSLNLQEFTGNKLNLKSLSLTENERKVRIRTQTNEQTKKSRKVRYSPTYVCSMKNPLPTFKLYNPDSSQPVYQYGFNYNQDQDTEPS